MSGCSETFADSPQGMELVKARLGAQPGLYAHTQAQQRDPQAVYSW